MTRIFSSFKRARTRPGDALACDIAASCVSELLQRLRSKTTEMSAPEMRGYLRARAFAVVRTRVEQTIADGRLPAADKDELIAAVLERTVHIVVRDLQSPPVIAVPSPHLRLRTAA